MEGPPLSRGELEGLLLNIQYPRLITQPFLEFPCREGRLLHALLKVWRGVQGKKKEVEKIRR
jgi:hypothetical protein